MAWGIMVLIGLPAAFVYEWRRDKIRPVPIVVRDWYGQVWLAFGISLLVGMFPGSKFPGYAADEMAMLGRILLGMLGLGG